MPNSQVQSFSLNPNLETVPGCKEETNSFLLGTLNLGEKQRLTLSEIAEFSARGFGVESKQVPAVIRPPLRRSI